MPARTAAGFRPHLQLVGAAALGLAAALFCGACSSGSDETPPLSDPRTATIAATATATRPVPAPTATASPPPTSTPEPVATPTPATEPVGFPFDPGTRLGVVVGIVPARRVEWSGGPAAVEYSQRDQVAVSTATANRSGWNCRVHVTYEGAPAVDWYLPIGTPLVAVMDGRATLQVITVSNAFEVYGVDREPYLGEPDAARAPLAPFPGPGGGKGVFVRLESDGFIVEYAHLDLGATLEAVPAGAFVGRYTRDADYAAEFGELRDFRESTPIAIWDVRRGETVGYSGDVGYSEAPHLHYTVRRRGGPLLCPTREPGFEDGGWLFR